MKKIIKRILITILSFVLMAVFLITIPAFNKRKANPFKGNTTTIIAHRGGSKINPQNTLGALLYTEQYFKDKKDVSWMQEIDVSMTKDKEIIVFHNYYMGIGHPIAPSGFDENTRTSCDNQFQGPIWDFTYDQIKNCDLTPQFEYENPGKKIAYPEGDYKIPKLEEIFKQVKNSVLILDFKINEAWGYTTADVEIAHKKIGALINKYNMWDKIIFYNLIDTYNLRKAIKYFKDEYNKEPIIIGSLDRNNVDKSKLVLPGDDVYAWSTKVKTLLSNITAKPIFDIAATPVEFQGTNFRSLISIVKWKAHQQNILSYWWNGYNTKDMELLLDKKVDGIFAANYIDLYNIMKERGLVK